MLIEFLFLLLGNREMKWGMRKLIRGTVSPVLHVLFFFFVSTEIRAVQVLDILTLKMQNSRADRQKSSL